MLEVFIFEAGDLFSEHDARVQQSLVLNKEDLYLSHNKKIQIPHDKKRRSFWGETWPGFFCLLVLQRLFCEVLGTSQYSDLYQKKRSCTSVDNQGQFPAVF